MKKTLLLLLAMLLATSISLISCGDDSTSNPDGTNNNTPACTHAYGEWVVEVEATRSEDGTKYRVCGLCSEKEYETLYATGTPGINYTVNADGKTCTVKRTTTLSDKELIIPKYIDGYEVVAIEKGAFNYLPFTSVVICDGLTSIGASAFSGCSSLASVTIPESVTDIGENAFSSCRSLTSVTIPGSVVNIDASAFYQCSGLSSVTISNGVKSISQKAFYGCTALTSVKLPDSLEVIGDSVFSQCTALTSITIPDNVETVGNSAFEYCSSLKNVTIGNGLKYMGNSVFYNCKEIVYNEYEGCNYLGNESNPYLLLCSASDNSRKAFVTHKDTRIIRYSAFSNNYNIEGIEISDSVINIGASAFKGCSYLKSMKVSKNVIYIGSGAFAQCQRLSAIEVDEKNENYKSVNGTLYTKDGKTLMQFCWGNSEKDVQVLAGVTKIDSYAFRGCEITSITIPDTLTEIGNDAFFCCYNLSNVYYAGSEEMWQKISIGSLNESLTGATIHYDTK